MENARGGAFNLEVLREFALQPSMLCVYNLALADNTNWRTLVHMPHSLTTWQHFWREMTSWPPS